MISMLEKASQEGMPSNKRDPDRYDDAEDNPHATNRAPTQRGASFIQQRRAPSRMPSHIEGKASSADEVTIVKADSLSKKVAGAFFLRSASTDERQNSRKRRRGQLQASGPMGRSGQMSVGMVIDSEKQDGEDDEYMKMSNFLRVPPLSVHPMSPRKQRWDMCTVIILAFCSFLIPFNVCFEWNPIGIIMLNYLIDVYFLADIFLNFITGVEKENKENDEMFISFRRKDIWINYLSGWFAVDTVSTIPWAELFVALGTSGDTKNLKRSLRLSRLLRLLKLGRMMKIKGRLEDHFQIQEGFKEVTNFLIMFALLSHWFACAFYALGDWNLDRQHATFIKETGEYECNGSIDMTECSWAMGRNLYTTLRAENYPAAGYWAVMTLTTVGYGDVSAKFTSQRYLGAFAMVVGALMFAYGVSHIVNIVEELQHDTHVFTQKLDKCNRYMQFRQLSKELRIDIREFLHNIHRRERFAMSNEGDILNNVSIGLRARVAREVNQQILQEMPFFVGADVNLTLDMALNMESTFYAAFEEVVIEGEEADAMYFIVAGSVEVLINVDGGKILRVATLKQHQYFGETALLQADGGRKRNATVKTIMFSEFRLLRVDDFLRILSNFPQMLNHIEGMAEHRKKGKEQARRRSISDMRKSGPKDRKKSRHQNDVSQLVSAQNDDINNMTSARTDRRMSKRTSINMSRRISDVKDLGLADAEAERKELTEESKASLGEVKNPKGKGRPSIKIAPDSDPVTPVKKGNHGDKSPGSTPHHGTEEEAIAAALARRSEADQAMASKSEGETITSKSVATKGGGGDGGGDGGGEGGGRKGVVPPSPTEKAGGMKRRYSIERSQLIDQISKNITDPEKAKQAIEAVKEAKNREGIRKTLTKVDPHLKQQEVHKSSRKSNYAIPLHLRHEKISTVAELALANTRWQKEMNTRMDDLDDFMCDTRDTLIEITSALKNLDAMMRLPDPSGANESESESESDDDVPNQVNEEGGYNFQLADKSAVSGVDSRGFKRQTSNWDTRN